MKTPSIVAAIALFTSLVINVPARAQQTTKILFPVVVQGELHGAFGSVWKTDTRLLNRSGAPLDIYWFSFCNTDPCPGPLATYTLPPQRVLPAAPSASPTMTGRIVLVDSGRAGDLVISTRVFDTSRSALNWGAQVSAVPETAAERAAVDFPSVITASPFRTTLRVYDFDPAVDHSVNVKVFKPGFPVDALIAQTTATLRPVTFGGVDPQYPGIAEVDITGLAPDEQSVRVRIEPVTPDLRYYALISVTNNDTQYLTILTPPPHAQ